MSKPAMIALLFCTLACEDRVQNLPEFNYCVKHVSVAISLGNQTDVLFVIDNSGSMAGKQTQLTAAMNYLGKSIELTLRPDYHLAVITTGMESSACQPCAEEDSQSCINESGEGGVFQDRIGHLTWDGAEPIFSFSRDESCRVVTSDNLECLFDEDGMRGTAMVGTAGCTYRRPLAAIKQALQNELLNTHNEDFLRPDAELWVILLSDGEDCGEPGEVSEGIPGTEESICAYAAKGIGPAGENSHPDDLDHKPYALTPVRDTYEFLMGLKDNKPDMVKFMAIVGVTDTADLSTTRIEYESDAPGAAVMPACSIADCEGAHCSAMPGTRAIQLAQLFGIGRNGFFDSICRLDSMSFYPPETFVSCPRIFHLEEAMLDPALAIIRFNDEPLPTFSCALPGQIVACQGPEDSACLPNDCAKSWTYLPPGTVPDPLIPGGAIHFAEHIDPCDLAYDLATDPPFEIRIDLDYVAVCDP